MLPFTKVFTIGEPVPLTLKPVTDPLNKPPVQLYVVPDKLEVNAMLVAVPLQIVELLVEPAGFGFTVTSKVNVAPTHPNGDVGVTVYLTTPSAVLLGLVNV